MIMRKIQPYTDCLNYKGHIIARRSERWHIVFQDGSKWPDDFHSSERAKRQIDYWEKIQ